MRKTLWIWSALCATPLAITFFGAPAWDSDTEGWELFSGQEVFALVAGLVIVVWVAGLSALVGILALVGFLGRDGRIRAWWGRRGPAARAATVAPIVLLAVAILSVAARLPGGGSEASDFVSFDTVDADPDWSPNGRSIAFTTNRGSGGVYVVRPDGTAMPRVFRGETRDVDWSPDGESIAFTGARGIYVIHLRRTSPKLVLRGRRFSLPVWAPNGRELAVVVEESGVYRGYDGPFEATSPAIYVVRLDGTGLRRLLPRYRGAGGGGRPGSVAATWESEPAWSPDGRRIAFQVGGMEIVSADVRTGARRTINQARAGYEPAWSPDGRLIAYQCEGDLCVANADGSGGERRVAAGGGDPSWSPDSRRIVFEHYLYGGSAYGSHPRSLSIVDASGKGLRKLTFGPSS